jgi:hypothetical protein
LSLLFMSCSRLSQWFTSWRAEISLNSLFST